MCAALAVVHLARYANGTAPFERFMDSYERHPAGVDHELVVIFKGFPDAVVPARFAERLQPHTPQVLMLDDSGFDLNSYWAAARLLDHEVLGFLNSFSTILADDWLAKLSGALRPPVGLVGATGSWESLGDAAVHVALRGLLVPPLGRAESPFGRLSLRDRLGLVRRIRDARAAYAPFPNPHLRSNAFFVRRALMMDVAPDPLRTKDDAFRFESGRRSFTNRVLEFGLQAVVVGCDGVSYQPRDWPYSRTFRCGDQGNLLVADNRTEDWMALSPQGRADLALLTWGRPNDRRVERMR